MLQGESPYVAPDAHEVAEEIAFIYPAVGALVIAPFGWLDHRSADVLFLFLNLVAVPLTLWVLGVRDWRVWGLAMLLPTVLFAWKVANVTLPIVLGLAVVAAKGPRDSERTRRWRF